ncbi:I78 family peptidase inhibitor [Profundibacter amoris]|nr:I78 family peptidase inhibitor [Profundibacter amoris]
MRFVILTFVGLAACTEIPPDPPIDQPTEDTTACGGGPDSNLVGQSVDVLAAMTFPGPMRVIRPGMLITQEYNPKRMNLDLDNKGIIIRVWCG